VLRQLFAKRRADGDGIEDRVHRDARELLLLLQRNAELLVRLENLGIHFLE
jgi:hypothetical protein